LKFYRKTRRQVIASILQLAFMQALTTTSVAYFMGGFAFPRSVLLGAAALQAVLLSAWNWLMLSLRDKYTETTYAMLIGSPDAAASLAGKLAGLIDREKIVLKYSFSPEENDSYTDAIAQSRVDEVFLCAGLSEDLKMEIMLFCMNHKVIVYLVPEVFEISLLSARVIHIDDTPLILLDRLSLSFEQRLLKRAFDLAATLAALPLLLPLLLAVAAGVKLTSPGRALYSQERVTSGGRVYKIYKFRTMREGAEDETGPVVSSGNDKRVTPFGGFLRRYHLDEFPQLINVLKGDMSLVGPRSERPFFTERFSRDIDGYDLRNNVKAGLTGYAQIFGHYDTEAELKLKYDILYIKNYSLLLDVKLILQTFNKIAGGRRNRGRGRNKTTESQSD
jgi:exopolysaccharide biosynthesis polyprenyl glycosylphosphotransferase